MPDSVTDFIDKLGGPAKIADAIVKLEPPRQAYKPGAVALWRFRNKIPRNAWPELLRAFPHLTNEALLAIEAASIPRRPDRKAKPASPQVAA